MTDQIASSTSLSEARKPTGRYGRYRQTARPRAHNQPIRETGGTSVANLVDNALHHNMAGGQIQITTTSVEGAAYIAVSNSGPVVPPAEVERLFQPSQQTGSERVGHTDGHGLGLAIVQAIAKAHGAKVTARPRPTGGLDIEVTFPSKIVS